MLFEGWRLDGAVDENERKSGGCSCLCTRWWGTRQVPRFRAQCGEGMDEVDPFESVVHALRSEGGELGEAGRVMVWTCVLLCRDGENKPGLTAVAADKGTVVGCGNSGGTYLAGNLLVCLCFHSSSQTARLGDGTPDQRRAHSTATADGLASIIAQCMERPYDAAGPFASVAQRGARARGG